MIEQEYKVLGLMSGTSLDGLDIALVHFRGKEFSLIRKQTLPYTKAWEKRLRFPKSPTALDLLQLNHEYGIYLGQCVLSFLKENKIDRREIDFIASHGHTWFHQPERGITYQLGGGPELAKISQIKTVTDFRTGDLALGGQGAPLVPIGDRDLFPQYDACLNLGGFANISFNHQGQRLAYDICPVNIVLNDLAQQLGHPFDKGGQLARNGKVIPELHSAVSQLKYFAQAAPKSLGVEWLNQKLKPLLEPYHKQPANVLNTMSSLAATIMAAEIDKFQLKSVLLSGGGAYNTYLVERLQKACAAKIHLATPEIIEYKEALIFAYLGVLRVEEKVNVLGSVTGASRNHCAGTIHLP